MNKVCSKCNQEKSLEFFVNDKKSKDGKSYWCKPCSSLNKKKWKSNNKEMVIVSHKRYYYNHLEAERERSRVKSASNRDESKRRSNEWRSANRERYNAYQAKRVAYLKLATPRWADLESIKSFYDNCPRGLEVDHVIPVYGKKVTGLHVLENLQYLTKQENCKKSNRLEGLS